MQQQAAAAAAAAAQVAAANNSGMQATFPGSMTFQVNPLHGPPDTQVTVSLDLHDLRKPINIKLAFGCLMVPIIMHPLDNGIATIVTVSPSWQHTGWPLNKVPLHAFIENDSNKITDSVYLGCFNIETPNGTRKRKKRKKKEKKRKERK